jgi:hypothetical protein
MQHWNVIIAKRLFRKNEICRGTSIEFIPWYNHNKQIRRFIKQPHLAIVKKNKVFVSDFYRTLAKEKKDNYLLSLLPVFEVSSIFLISCLISNFLASKIKLSLKLSLFKSQLAMNLNVTLKHVICAKIRLSKVSLNCRELLEGRL